MDVSVSYFFVISDISRYGYGENDKVVQRTCGVREVLVGISKGRSVDRTYCNINIWPCAGDSSRDDEAQR